jgi:uncharacterized membrane protein SpoIIM required for sporulation
LTLTILFAHGEKMETRLLFVFAHGLTALTAFAAAAAALFSLT